MDVIHRSPVPDPGPGGAGRSSPGGLRIEVAGAVGHGQTTISSFDDALLTCGVHNYNLIDLSSVIPPGATVVPVRCCHRPTAEFGHRLYVVRAEARSDVPGTVLAAGIGWHQWGDGRGLFVEHAVAVSDASPAAVEADLRSHLRLALADLCAGRGVPFEPDEVCARVVVGRVEERPTTALVLAVYGAEGW